MSHGQAVGQAFRRDRHGAAIACRSGVRRQIVADVRELATLLEMGTSDGAALLARTYANRAVSVYRKPAATAARWTYAGNRLLDMHGQDAPDGFLPAGEWVHLADDAGLGPWAALSPVFVERAEYDATAGRLQIEPEGAGDIYETGARQG